MTPEESEFIMAVDRYKLQSGKKFPLFTDILKIAYSLGYRKVAEPEPLPVYVRHKGRPKGKTWDY